MTRPGRYSHPYTCYVDPEDLAVLHSFSMNVADVVRAAMKREADRLRAIAKFDPATARRTRSKP